ncbi:MAG: hypothetical protein IJ634_00815 [Bacteroidales bacterium]|nr:hypothetical protein [Bacteroidales bacterium]
MQKIGSMMDGSTFFVGNNCHRAMDKKIKKMSPMWIVSIAESPYLWPLAPALIIAWIGNAIADENDAGAYFSHFLYSLIPIVGIIMWYFKKEEKGWEKLSKSALWCGILGFVANVIILVIVLN